MWRTSLFWTVRPTFYIIFFRYIVLWCLVLCLMIWCVNCQEYDNLLQFNTSWLASPGTKYYFSFCFSFSSSDYDLSLIKKSHTLNCYSFLQKFLLKSKTYKLIVGNCSSSIYCLNNKFRKSSLLFLTGILLNKKERFDIFVSHNVNIVLTSFSLIISKLWK